MFLCSWLFLNSLFDFYFSDEDEVSYGSAEFQPLTVDSHDQGASHEEDRRAVVIPNHLLINTEECSQLSFGSFGAFGTRPLSNNAEETPDVAQQIEHSDARYPLFQKYSMVFYLFMYYILTDQCLFLQKY